MIPLQLIFVQLLNDAWFPLLTLKAIHLLSTLMMWDISDTRKCTFWQYSNLPFQIRNCFHHKISSTLAFQTSISILNYYILTLRYIFSIKWLPSICLLVHHLYLYHAVCVYSNLLYFNVVFLGWTHRNL